MLSKNVSKRFGKRSLKCQHSDRLNISSGLYRPVSIGLRLYDNKSSYHRR